MSKVERQVVATRKSKSQAIKVFVVDIEELTEENADFRRVLYSGKNRQLVLMAIQTRIAPHRGRFGRLGHGGGAVGRGAFRGC